MVVLFAVMKMVSLAMLLSDAVVDAAAVFGVREAGNGGIGADGVRDSSGGGGADAVWADASDFLGGGSGGM